MQTMKKKPSSFGTWYTDAGERADAWPAETPAAPASSTTAPTEAMIASSVHAMAGAGGGLLSRVARLLGSGSTAPIARLL